MYELYHLVPVVLKAVMEEQPLRILEISNRSETCGRFLKAAQLHCGIHNGIIDKISLNQSFLPDEDSPYSAVYGPNRLDDPNSIGEYDFIFILDYFELTDTEAALQLLDALQHKINKQIMIVTPLLCEANFRKYHPVVFLGLDFSYSLLETPNETVQIYNIFPKKEYKPLPCDQLPGTGSDIKLSVAFILPHQALTGGMKALLQQIRQLSRRGHTVTVYFRSDQAEYAIPPWSDLTEIDYARQVVIPASMSYSDHVREADVIFLGWMDQIPEFASSNIPVVLWEQGSEMMYGDFGKALSSTAPERLHLHRLFRTPINLMAVSVTNIAVLKGIYNRDAYMFPVGIDTSFYAPSEKENEMPVILLVGNPSLTFKGFKFAFDVLQQSYVDGLRFQVKWATQIPVQHGRVDFPLEIIVNPVQSELASLYRNADIFLSSSLYESYPLPPLEAMASGTAVIATDNGGIRTYAVSDENCILCRQGDKSAMVNALKLLLNDRDERQRLVLAGRKTALTHSAERTAVLLENYLAGIARRVL